jgi:hypothetical protein
MLTWKVTMIADRLLAKFTVRTAVSHVVQYKVMGEWSMPTTGELGQLQFIEFVAKLTRLA